MASEDCSRMCSVSDDLSVRRIAGTDSDTHTLRLLGSVKSYCRLPDLEIFVRARESPSKPEELRKFLNTSTDFTKPNQVHGQQLAQRNSCDCFRLIPRSSSKSRSGRRGAKILILDATPQSLNLLLLDSWISRKSPMHISRISWHQSTGRGHGAFRNNFCQLEDSTFEPIGYASTAMR